MIKKIILFISLMFSAYGFSQKTNSSPYSFFGIGDQVKLKSVEEISMGQIGGTLDGEYRLSLTNPASYADLKLTTYVFSGGSTINTINDGNDKQTSSATSLNYIALGIPIKTNQGLAFGLQLNTSVGYSLLDKRFDNVNGENTLVETTKLSGDGGTNRVFLGYAYHFPFNLNLGVEAAYIFGGIENSILNRRLDVQLATKSEAISYVNGFSYKFGAQYTRNLKNNLKLLFGVSASLSNTLNEKGDIYLSTVESIEGGGTVIDRDTISNYKARIESPLKSVLSAGIGKNNKWFVGTEFTFQNAIRFKNGLYNETTNYYYDKSSTFAIGGFYIPKHNSITSYWNRVTYRAGFNYKTLGLVINNTQIKESGISFGVSLPLGVRISNVNIGLEFGKRGTNKNNLVKENYYNFRLNLSLNDKWFNKRKIY